MTEPRINLGALSADVRRIADRIISTSGVSRGRIRSTRPRDNEAYYVWRMVRFYSSPDPRALSRPVRAHDALPAVRARSTFCSLRLEADLAAQIARRASTIERLHAAVAEILGAITEQHRYRVSRWLEVADEYGVCSPMNVTRHNAATTSDNVLL